MYDKVYVIGCKDEDTDILVRKLNLAVGTEIVFVDCIGQVPGEVIFEKEIKDSIVKIEYPDPPLIQGFCNEKREHKGHERPYRFHR